MKRAKQRLAELSSRVNNNKGTKDSDLLLLFIGETMNEMNGNIKWLMAMVGVGIAILITLAVGG